MNELIKDLEEVIEKKSENHELKQELSILVKMLKTGFETKNAGMEKPTKIFAANDSEKIKKFYDNFGNQILGLKLSGNLDKFVEYLSITYGINISLSDTSPNLQYIKKPKKMKKFEDLFTGYFIDDVPKEPKTAVERILKSLDALTKDFTKEADIVKESLKDVITKHTDKYESTTIKTLDKIMTSARIKSLKVDDVATETEAKLNFQQMGVDLALKHDQEPEDEAC